MRTRTRRVSTVVVMLALVGTVAGCGGTAAGTGSAKTRPEQDSAGPSVTTSAATAPSSTSPPPSTTVVTSGAVSETVTATQPADGASTTSAPAVELEGTTWAGTDSDGDAYVYRFNPGGHLGFTSPSGTYDDAEDTWSQSGDQVTMSTANGYSTYQGTIQSGQLSGTASNVVGHQWTWTATPQ